MPAGFLHRVLPLFAVAFLAAGCASFTGYPDSVVEPGDELTQLKPYFLPPMLKTYDDTVPETDRRKLRDQIVYARMRAYDIQFREFEKALTAQAGATALTTDLLALTLSGLSATVGGEGAKSALSVASGGVLGAKGNINKDLFYEKTLPALFTQMEAQRLKARVAIETGLGMADADYPLRKAFIDLETYLSAGSLPGALSGITQDAGTKTKDAESEIQSIRVSRDATRIQGDDGKGEASVEAITARIDTLTDLQAIGLVKVMEAEVAKLSPDDLKLVQGFDTTNKRYTYGVSAREFLRRLLLHEDPTAETIKRWTDAIDNAVK